MDAWRGRRWAETRDALGHKSATEPLEISFRGRQCHSRVLRHEKAVKRLMECLHNIHYNMLQPELYIRHVCRYMYVDDQVKTICMHVHINFIEIYCQITQNIIGKI